MDRRSTNAPEGAPQSGWFGGSMADVGIFDTVLTAAQVAAQYDMGT